MKKTLSVRPVEDRTEPPKLQKKGRGWTIAESRLDTLHETAREMRRNPTEAQTALAESLIRAELGKFRFRRHVVIGSAIVDFACQLLRIVVQIDDAAANGDPAIARRRDKSLEEVGLQVLRFPAEDILADADAVTATIVAEMKARYDAQRAKPRPSRPRTQNASYPSKGRGYQR